MHALVKPGPQTFLESQTEPISLVRGRLIFQVFHSLRLEETRRKSSLLASASQKLTQL